MKSATAQLTPEHAALLALDARMARIEERLSRLCPPEKPMRINEFAERVGLSRWAIQTRIRNGEILKKGGLIPASELRRFGL